MQKDFRRMVAVELIVTSPQGKIYAPDIAALNTELDMLKSMEDAKAAFSKRR